jgi:hypothetical protein
MQADLFTKAQPAGIMQDPDHVAQPTYNARDVDGVTRDTESSGNAYTCDATFSLGAVVGVAVGDVVGVEVGSADGAGVGSAEGAALGLDVGCTVGSVVGATEGSAEGKRDDALIPSTSNTTNPCMLLLAPHRLGSKYFE